MTILEKVEKIYHAMPELINDDMGLAIFVMNKYLAKHNAPLLTKAQENAFREMGNPDHYLRRGRTLRADNEWVRDRFDEKVKEAKEKEFIDFKYNAKIHTEEEPTEPKRHEWRKVFNK